MTYLFLSPHPDDVELTCGGTISKLKSDVHIAVFSDCDLPDGEVSRAHDVLNVISHYFYFDRRTFPDQRQGILDALIDLRDRLTPDVVFIPDMSDVHQDHQVIAMEGLRAFKMSSDIISYSHPHNQINGYCNYFVSLTDEDLENKIKALDQYKSQVDRFYFNPEAVRGVARYYGVQCQTKYAEAFKIIRKHES